jgi:uncharacterized protein YebE (UPF0316 family)
MLTFVLTPQAWLGAGLIFLLRVTDMTLDTMRVMMVMRGKRGFVWILGFFQATVFVVAITSVLSNLDNPLNILAYAAGFATGNVVGMWIEERLAIGHTHMSIVSPTLGAAIAEQMRLAGYAITEIPARGKDGMVTLLSCSVLRKNVEKVHQIVNAIDPTAFITAEDVRPVRRGFWRA